MPAILFFLFLLNFYPVLEAKTLHAILVVDNIHDISSVTKADLIQWQKELRIITRQTKMVLKEQIFTGSRFNKQLVGNYLKDLKIDKQDSVIFYFSGHGYRTSTKKTPWPFITFEFYKPGIDGQWIIQTIREKNPHFALILTDCCNNFMEFGFFGHETKNVQMKLRKVLPFNLNYEQLFVKAKGCIAITSSSPGQFSYGSSFGGLYTQCFFHHLNRELAEKNPSWKNLLQRVNGSIDPIQKPICEVYR